MVAADWDELEANDRLVLSLLAIAFAALVAIGAVGALLLGVYLRRRLSTISIAAEQIMAGNVSQRISIGPRGDEFDRLASVLNAMLDRNGELVDNLRQVSSDIAHDLRTPLTRLRNHLTNEAVPSNVRIDQAVALTDDVLGLFSAILRLSEIEAGSLTDMFTDVDLHALTSNVIGGYAPSIEDAGRHLEWRLDTVRPVRGDTELLVQALVNLIENAQVHTPQGTTIRVGLIASAQSIGLSVSDDGPGIAAEDRERALRRFTRLDTSRSRPGHGLGLSIVSAIAEAHGARLHVTDNAPGLTVTIVFPM